MNKIGAYRRRVVLVMVVVMSLHIVSGLQPFCPKGFFAPLRALGIGLTVLAVNAAELDRVEVAGTARKNPDAQGDTSNCNCKKQKKCPAIPRALITSNPAYRFNELQRQAKTVCCEPVFSRETEHCLMSEENRLLMELACYSPFFCFNPLGLSSVLLI